MNRVVPTLPLRACLFYKERISYPCRLCVLLLDLDEEDRLEEEDGRGEKICSNLRVLLLDEEDRREDDLLGSAM